MRIALLTIWHEKNYGAELQAYATVKILQQLGHDVKMIDIRLSDCHRLSLNGKIAQFIEPITPSHRQFCKFWRKYIPTTRRYHSIRELQDCPPEADVYMVGSDQVWNPDITSHFSLLYFLDYGNERVKRISYASSFGTSQWQHPTLTARVGELLHRFDSVSCREESGVTILRDSFGISAQCVLDPTLLLTDYSLLTGEIHQKTSLVYYPLSCDAELENYAESLARRLNLSPINNKRCSYLFGKIVWNRVSIGEWIRNIAEAQFVVTRSFHGMVFSLLYKRQFAVLSGANGRSTRLQNLLEKLGLSDRIYPSVDALDAARPWEQTIDYSQITPLLQQMRTESMNYLHQNLTQ